ncbi:MAG: hypothetical protein WAK75_08925 [Methanoregula sp.]|uniref:hypothetical protein n=1 Tax=Methanoregula sp. TaxID=2052170 RepID=UPI003BB1D5C3
MSSAKSSSTISKTQLSYLFFIIGLVLLIIPELNGLDFLPVGIRAYFALFFYPGIVCVIIGYILK